ncbi:MAG: hypothetical protein ABSG76_15280 [Xanthobacteraceae bacterium]
MIVGIVGLYLFQPWTVLEGPKPRRGRAENPHAIRKRAIRTTRDGAHPLTEDHDAAGDAVMQTRDLTKELPEAVSELLWSRRWTRRADGEAHHLP